MQIAEPETDARCPHRYPLDARTTNQSMPISPDPCSPDPLL